MGYDLLENPPLNLLGVETAELKPTGPKTFNSDPAGYISQAKDIVELSNNLTDRQKVIAEYWESGKRNRLHSCGISSPNSSFIEITTNSMTM